MNTFPEDWTTRPLGDFLDLITYGFTNPMPTTDAGPFMLTAKDIRSGKIDYATARHTSLEAFSSSLTNKSRPQIGDVLLTKDGSIGRVAVCDRSNVCINQSVALLRPNSDILPTFLSYLLQAPVYQSRMESDSDGSTIKHIYITRVDKMPISVPDLHGQAAIVEVLAGLDEKIAANTKLAATASELAGLKYDHSAAGFDPRPMSDVLTPVLGGTPARSRADFWGGDRLWASAKDITGAQFGVVLSTDEKITEAAVAGTKAKPLPAGSVILTARGTVGAVARLAAPASFNQSCYGFVPGAIPPGVLYFAITRAVLRAKEIAHGSVFDTITMKTFDHLPFSDFDAEALAATEGEIGPLLEVVAGVVRENSSLATTRDALLPQLMSGKLRVKDAEKAFETAGV